MDPTSKMRNWRTRGKGAFCVSFSFAAAVLKASQMPSSRRLITSSRRWFASFRRLRSASLISSRRCLPTRRTCARLVAARSHQNAMASHRTSLMKSLVSVSIVLAMLLLADVTAANNQHLSPDAVAGNSPSKCPNISFFVGSQTCAFTVKFRESDPSWWSDLQHILSSLTSCTWTISTM